MVEIFWDDLEDVQSTSNGVGVHTPQELIPVFLHEGVRLEILTEMRIIEYYNAFYNSKHYDITLVLHTWTCSKDPRKGSISNILGQALYNIILYTCSHA